MGQGDVWVVLYLPPGWVGAVSVKWALCLGDGAMFGCLGGTYIQAGRAVEGRDSVWAVLTSGLGGHCKSGMVV